MFTDTLCIRTAGEEVLERRSRLHQPNRDDDPVVLHSQSLVSDVIADIRKQGSIRACHFADQQRLLLIQCNIVNIAWDSISYGNPPLLIHAPLTLGRGSSPPEHSHSICDSYIMSLTVPKCRLHFKLTVNCSLSSYFLSCN